LFDWLETEFPFFPTLRALDREHAIRCEEYIEGGKYVLRAELPGIDPDKDVDVSITGGVLRVTAERREIKKEHHRSEFSYGSFHRALTLPEGADQDSVTASYQDGILQVTVALPERSIPEPKRIPIERGTTESKK
jgi:HSP20 family molecular chaperone IbpA